MEFFPTTQLVLGLTPVCFPQLWIMEKVRLALSPTKISDTPMCSESLAWWAVEHPVMYCDCPEHRFHVPIYSRAFVRDPYTLKPAGYGTPGLLQLMTPMVKATPLSCVMTDDLAVMRDGADCPCGIKTPYIELLGRAGLADVKTCAAEAAKTLREVKL